jgi:hypothetical protein
VLKILVVMATTAVGMVLLSCSAPKTDRSPSTSTMVYEPSAPVARTPLAPPVGYASPPPQTHSVTPLASFADRSNADFGAPTVGPGAWQASPRWRAVKGEGCIEVEQDPQAKYRVESCSREDNGETAR